jgi:fructose-1,6-bisphosphatase/inositol monophosphatase family enzyme
VPGTLIHAEAGGHVARFDGTPYLPRHIEGGIIAAPDQSSWIELRAALMG